MGYVPYYYPSECSHDIWMDLYTLHCSIFKLYHHVSFYQQRKCPENEYFEISAIMIYSFRHSWGYNTDHYNKRQEPGGIDILVQEGRRAFREREARDQRNVQNNHRNRAFEPFVGKPPNILPPKYKLTVYRKGMVY